MKKVRDGYKITELGEIPSDWNIMKLSEVAEIVMGQSPDSSSYNDTEDGVAFFQGKTEFGRINPVVKKWCNNPTKISKPLDILISVRAPVGDVNINNIEACIGRGLGAIRATSGSNYKYLYYAIQKYNNQLKKASQGSTFEAINSNDLKGLKLPIPHIDEQEKIALILSNVDEQIDNVDALIEKNKELKKGLMQTLLTKGIGHTKFKKTEIGEIPEEWQNESLGDMVNFEGGTQPPKKYFSNECLDGMIRLIQIRDYKSDKFKVYVPKELCRRFCDKSDVMIGRYGPPIFQILRGLEGAYNVALIKATPINERLDREYLYYFLNNEKLFNLIDSLSQRTSGQTGIDMEVLKAYKIPIPPKKEQEKIVLTLSQIDKRIENYENRNKKLEELKKGLMQQLLTGKIRTI